MNPFWVDNHGTIQGLGTSLLAEPGTGEDRYHTALDDIRRSDRDRAFASFTFDAQEVGSIVDMPETVYQVDGLGPGRPAGRARVVNDGVAEWRVGFGKAMLEIETGRVDKVVLARQVLLEFDEPPDLAGLVSRLSAANPGCYIFSVGGLVGASPELLVSLRRGRISTLALAGTATDPNQLDTEKISEEHRHVSSSVTTVLEDHIAEV
ncbi:MAG TPA: chorismate-binding protein, partial [Acidimicrobiia bacterium]|nr:chorismate-binding protein [Acidimicrobiia bacterium]